MGQVARLVARWSGLQRGYPLVKGAGEGGVEIALDQDPLKAQAVAAAMRKGQGADATGGGFEIGAGQYQKGRIGGNVQGHCLQTGCAREALALVRGAGEPEHADARIGGQGHLHVLARPGERAETARGETGFHEIAGQLQGG